MNYFYFSTLICIVLMFLLSCKDKDFISNSTTQNQHEDTLNSPYISSVNPQMAFPKEHVVIIGGNFNNIHGDVVLAFGTFTALIDSLNSTRIYTTVPDSAVNCQINLKIGSKIIEGPNFVVLTGDWRITGSLSFARANHTATLLKDGRVLVAGGENVPFCEVFDPTTNSWNLAGTLPLSKSIASATLLSNGKVLFTGGHVPNSDSTSSECYLYDPASNSWRTCANLNEPRAGHESILLPTGMVLVSSGYYANHIFSKTCELYNPALDKWSYTDSLDIARASYSGILLSDREYLIVCGQISVSLECTASAEVYDIAQQSWSKSQSLNEKRLQPGIIMLPSGPIIAIGGANPVEYFYNPGSSICESMSFASRSWKSMSSIDSNIISFTCILLKNGNILVAGGTVLPLLNQIPRAKSFLFPLQTNAWQPTRNMVIGRFSHTSTLLNNGNVLVVGGNDGKKILSSCELFIP